MHNDLTGFIVPQTKQKTEFFSLNILFLEIHHGPNDIAASSINTVTACYVASDCRLNFSSLVAMHWICCFVMTFQNPLFFSSLVCWRRNESGILCAVKNNQTHPWFWRVLRVAFVGHMRRNPQKGTNFGAMQWHNQPTNVHSAGLLIASWQKHTPERD